VSYLTQKTIKNNVSFSGVALHSGININICIKPAEPNHGIVFKRVDLKVNNLVYPNFMNVTNTLDGSAKEFIEKIISSGLLISEAPIKIIKINKEIKFTDGERYISIEPSTLSLDIDFKLKYKNLIIGNQSNKVKVFEDDLTDIYNSRTFCLFEDIEVIKKNGLAKGGSLDNAIVVKDNDILNSEGLRNDKEFVNHKILDCIGDLYTSGYRIIAKINCSQGGHYLTNQLLRKVFENKDNFSIVEIKEKNLPHALINRSLLKSIA